MFNNLSARKFDPVALANAIAGKLPEKLQSEKLRLKTLDVILNIGIPFNRWLGLRLKEFSDDQVVVESPPRTLRKNHVGTTHACAQALMGEYSAGLLVAQNYPITEHRMIISQLSMDYRKAGVGTLRATARAPEVWPDLEDEAWVDMETTITNEKQEIVSICKTRWQVKKWSDVRSKKSAA